MTEDSKIKKVLEVIGDILVYLIMIVSITFTLLTFSSLKSESGLPSIKGYMLFSVQSDSMEPVFYVGDLLLIKPYNNEDLKVGDIISFRTIENDHYKINTHRVVKVNDIGGTVTYSTMGDNTIGQDKSDVVKSEIVGVYSRVGENDDVKTSDNGSRVPKLGSVMDFLKGKYGFLFCVILPLALIFFYMVYKFIVTLIETKKEAALEEVASKEELTEELKKKAIEEYLQKQAEEQAKEKDEPNDSDEKTDEKDSEPENAEDEKEN